MTMKSRLPLVCIGWGAFVAAGPAQRSAVFEQIRTSTDVARLEAIAGDEVSADSIIPEGYIVGALRSQAYVRLGALGTAESVAAVGRIETRADTAPLLPETVSFDRWPHVAPHFGDGSVTPLATVVLPGGELVGLLRAGLLGGDDLFLVRAREGGRWTRPKLIDRRFSPNRNAAVLTATSATEVVLDFEQVPVGDYLFAKISGIENLAPSLSAGPQQWRLSLPVIEQDTDGDGWTDAEEKRLGLNPAARDSDRDGRDDGRDTCPNLRASAENSTADDAIILSRAAFAVYGVNRSRSAMLVSDSRPVHLSGFRGPVIFGLDRNKWMGEYQHGFVFVKWRIGTRTADEVKVLIDDYEAPMAASGHEVTLKRLHGQWVVVQSKMLWIS
jgi:hypothetical protein